MSVNPDLKVGIELVSKAAEHDTAQRYQEASYLYTLSVEHFNKALQNEYNDQTKQMILQKVSQYNARIQQIKEAFAKSKQISSQPSVKVGTMSSSSSDISALSTAPPKPTAVPTAIPSLTPADIKKLSMSDALPSVPKDVPSTKPPIDVVSAPPSIDWSSLQAVEKNARASQKKLSESTGEIFSELEKAMKLIEKATEEELAKNYESALNSYRSALDSFVKALDVEKNSEVKKVISEKMAQYLARAELIKEVLKARDSKSTKKDSQKSISAAPKAPVRAEVSVTAQQFVQAGIEAAEKAIECDECYKFEEAIEKYDESIQFFTAALQKETNEPVKAMIKEKLVNYSTRIEQLRQYKATGAFVPSPIKIGLKEGEKYKEPETKKPSRKDKKTWH